MLKQKPAPVPRMRVGVKFREIDGIAGMHAQSKESKHWQVFVSTWGRLGTAAAFLIFGFVITLEPESQVLLLSPLYLLGAVVVLFGKETRGEELPE